MSTVEELMISTFGYKKMDQIRYIKEYCGNKYSNFTLPLIHFAQTAYCDIQYWVDHDKKILVYNSIYIGE